MVRAYIMVKVHTSEADRIQEMVSGLDGVERAYIVAGDVDLIAVISVESPGEVKDIATAGIQSIDGVSGTQTYLAMN